MAKICTLVCAKHKSARFQINQVNDVVYLSKQHTQHNIYSANLQNITSIAYKIIRIKNNVEYKYLGICMYMDVYICIQYSPPNTNIVHTIAIETQEQFFHTGISV